MHRTRLLPTIALFRVDRATWCLRHLEAQLGEEGAAVAVGQAVLTRTTTLIGIAALSLFMLETRDAPAHANVAAALPNDGSILDHVPERVVLRFSSKIVSRSTKIELKGPHGSSSLSYQGTGGEPTRELSIPVPDQGNGAYYVKWEILSTDGDHLGGKVRFSVRPKETATE